MASDKNTEALTDAERESREVAEHAREKEWKQPSFIRELFLGNFRLDVIHPFPTRSGRPEFIEFRTRFERFLAEKVDPTEIDATGEYPDHVIEGLKQIGAFGMKIPTEYGGLGLNQVEYSQIMELLGTYCGNLSALLSAHQSIGVPQPLKVFGTEEQKREFLPRCAAGAISAFALTEPSVGSDPAQLQTTAELTPDGTEYVINGEKLWCTNGTLAELLVVMTRGSESKRISAFVVEASSPGVTIQHRCRFMGLKALSNAVIRFDNVRVPKTNLIGKEGQGLKIALVTLNTGRLSLPAGATGSAKRCLQICREWASEREQWGVAIGKHEAIGSKLADMAATTFGMDSLSLLASEMADRGNYDIRLEAAAAKEWNTVEGWRIVDDTMQIRGGRGYETESSLASRGDKPIAVERMMRDFRINTIFEGSSEIMHLFMAREAVDKHLQVAGDLVDPNKTVGAKLAALPRIAAFYAWWYPTRWVGWGRWPRYSEFGRLAKHLRFVERNARKLARQSFHGMVVHGPKLERRQGFLFRVVDVANELFVMAASCSRAARMRGENHAQAKQAERLADLLCRRSRRRVNASFKALWSNDDKAKHLVSKSVLSSEQAWLEQGLVQQVRQTAPQPVPAEREIPA
jgi:alkylation response protein AidB-like acyl-CoA dehydrogenase